MFDNPSFKTYVALAILMGIWLVIIAHYGSMLVYHPGEIHEPAYPLLAAGDAASEAPAAAEQPGEATAAESPAGGGDVLAMLADANPEAGARVSKKCAACHSLDKDGKNKVGPNLWDVVGRPIGSHEGFKYSSTLADMGGDWSYERLDAFLTSPKDYAAGTKMSFAGLKDAGDRANLIAFLRNLSDSPKPLP